MICLPFGTSQMAGWLVLDFCLALFFIQRIGNKKALTLVIVLQFNHCIYFYYSSYSRIDITCNHRFHYTV